MGKTREPAESSPRRRRGRVVAALAGAVCLLVGAALVSQGGFAGFTTKKTLTQGTNSSSAYFALTLDAGSTTQLQTAVSDMMPGDVRESLVQLAPPAGGVSLTNLTYQATGTLVSDPDGGGTDVLAANTTDGISVEIRSCGTGSTFRTRTVNTPVVGANDVYCDNNSTGTPSSWDAGDTEGTIVGAAVDPVSGAARPASPLTLTAGPVVAGSPALFSVRIVFNDNGGDQNAMQHESFKIDHAFSASPPRASGNV